MIGSTAWSAAMQIDAGAMDAEARSGRFCPRELIQQRAVAALDYASVEIKQAFLAALLGRPVTCPSCGQAPRLWRVATGWDLQLYCGTSTCGRFDRAIINIELKPTSAPPHVSFAPLAVWRDREERGLITILPGSEHPAPSAECGRGTCTTTACVHPKYRFSPVMSQIVAAAEDDTPIVVLTDYRGDASTIWATREWGYIIADAPRGPGTLERVANRKLG